MTQDAEAGRAGVYGEAELRTKDGRVIRLVLTPDEGKAPEPDNQEDDDNGDHA